VHKHGRAAMGCGAVEGTPGSRFLVAPHRIRGRIDLPCRRRIQRRVIAFPSYRPSLRTDFRLISRQLDALSAFFHKTIHRYSPRERKKERERERERERDARSATTRSTSSTLDRSADPRSASPFAVGPDPVKAKTRAPSPPRANKTVDSPITRAIARRRKRAACLGYVSFGLSVRNGQAADGPATRSNTHRELLIL